MNTATARHIRPMMGTRTNPFITYDADHTNKTKKGILDKYNSESSAEGTRLFDSLFAILAATDYNEEKNKEKGKQLEGSPFIFFT